MVYTTKNKCFLILFLVWLIIVNPPSSIAKTVVSDPGKNVHSQNVNCGGVAGKVTVNEDMSVTVDLPPTEVKIEGETYEIVSIETSGVLGIGYTSTNAKSCHWIQFVMVQAWIEKDQAKIALGPGFFKSSNSKMPYTSDKNNPQWKVDSASETDPSYGSKGTKIKNGNSNTIFDRPDQPLDAIWDFEYQSDPDVTKIRVLVTFNSYLICNKEICYKIKWSMEQEWERGKGKSKSAPKFVEGTHNSELTENQKKALKAEYPNQKIVNID